MIFVSLNLIIIAGKSNTITGYFVRKVFLANLNLKNLDDICEPEFDYHHRQEYYDLCFFCEHFQKDRNIIET